LLNTFQKINMIERYLRGKDMKILAYYSLCLCLFGSGYAQTTPLQKKVSRKPSVLEKTKMACTSIKKYLPNDRKITRNN